MSSQLQFLTQMMRTRAHRIMQAATQRMAPISMAQRCRFTHQQSSHADATITAAARSRCAIHSTIGNLSSYTAAASCSSRSFHSSVARSSITGISFSPVPPHELKVIQWLKAQEIAGRRRAAHQTAAAIWTEHPNETWSNLTPKRSEELLRAHGDPTPSEWDITEFFHHTLETKCRWRFDEMLRERKSFFESALTKMMKELRAESDAYRHGTMLMTKNELTRKLTQAMNGKLPSASEVEDAWQDRHSIPAIEWVEDAI